MKPQAEAICVEFIKWVYAKHKYGWCCDSFEVKVFGFLKHPEYIKKHYDFLKGKQNEAD